MEKMVFWGDYLTEKYGKKLQRVSIDLALGCPNRLNRYGNGCVFCAEDGNRARHLFRNLDLENQVVEGVKYIKNRYGASAPYIAYFQSFTSTYAPVDKLREYYEKVLSLEDFAVVIIGTRPDALGDDIVEYLQELSLRYELWVELGVQSTNDKVLEVINRGHDFSAVEVAVKKLHNLGIKVAAHMIAGLPCESSEEFVSGAKKLALLPFDGIKIHPLLLLKNTVLASENFPYKFNLLNEYEYSKILKDFLKLLPENWKIMRLTAEAPEEQLIAPKWWMSKGQFIEYFKDYFYNKSESFAKIKSGDGSYTVYHPQYRQHFNSLTGAVEEAQVKFVKASKLEQHLCNKDIINLLDIGFGLGVNVFESVKLAQKLALGHLSIVSLEIDKKVLEVAYNLYGENSLEREIVSSLLDNGIYKSNFVDIELIVGDARESILHINKSFEVVFQDGFSPDKNPELWSYDFICQLKKHLANDGLIVSYSSSHAYRGALLKNKLNVGESEPCGRKRSGTISGYLEELQLPEKELGIILKSVAGVPYRDINLNSSAQNMIDYRKKTVAKLRQYGVPKWYKIKD